MVFEWYLSAKLLSHFCMSFMIVFVISGLLSYFVLFQGCCLKVIFKGGLRDLHKMFV